MTSNRPEHLMDFDEYVQPWRILVDRRRTPEQLAHAHAQVLERISFHDPLIEPDNCQVLIVGDLHGSAHRMVKVVEEAHEQGITLLLQLGDTFGTHPDPAQGAMDVLSDRCRQHDIDMVLVWGNHDRWPDEHLYPLHPVTGLRSLRPYVWLAPRGHTWTWGTTRWTAVGGAVSVDRAARAEGASVFTDLEQVSDTDIDQIIDAVVREHGGTDVLLTHDRPAWVDLALDQDPTAWWDHTPPIWAYEDLSRSLEHQQRLDRLVAALQPRLHLHGHLHRRYTLVSDRTPHGGRCRVEGLAHDAMPHLNTLVIPTRPDLEALTRNDLRDGDAR